MGVRTEQIKRAAKELIKRFPNKFSGDFESNKRVVRTLVQGTTVKVNNQIAGYVTRVYALTHTESAPSETEEEGE